jgi:transcription initiation factor TFIIIB Brf1 subunit/transcription initiation factor TFIIB
VRVFTTRNLTMVPWQAKLRQGEKKLPMATPATATSSVSSVSSLSLWNNSNGPDTPPVIFTNSSNSSSVWEEDEEQCRNCHATDLVTDWKQGDRVCTSCGVVSEERLRDDRPEWKDFNDAEDIVKRGSNASNGRSGLVAVDETKYFGGLEPTTLSKQPFGGHTTGGYGLAKLQKRLKTTNQKLDALMERAHKQTLKDAKIKRNIRIKQQQQQPHNYMLQEEDDEDDEDVHRMQAALYAEKWSLDRAILVHGTGDEQGDNSSSSNNNNNNSSREELLSRLDSVLQKATKDLYTAYRIITQAAQTLHLPDRVTNEIVHRLVRYATQRDGLSVKGVSNRLSKTTTNNNNNSNNILQQSAAEKKKFKGRLQEYNKLRQMSALGAAMIYLTSKSMGYTRSIAQICSCFQPDSTVQGIHQDQGNTNANPFIKPKHCSKAMNEIKATFPEYVAGAVANNLHSSPTSVSSSKDNDNDESRRQDSLASVNFADHFLQALQLPPVAEASIKTLLAHCRTEQIQLGRNSGTQLPTLCAALTFFVCATGSVMQRLAQQVQPPQQKQKQQKQQQEVGGAKEDGKTKRSLSSERKAKESSTKRRKLNDNQKGDVDTTSDEDSDASVTVKDHDDDDDEPFDVFSHAPIVEDRSEKQKYEMRRMWDAWREQMPWSRSAIQIEQSCGISRDRLLEFHKSHLYPRREELLDVLKDMATKKDSNILQETPLASTLLGYIQTAAALMGSK